MVPALAGVTCSAAVNFQTAPGALGKQSSCQRFLSKRFRSKPIERHGTYLSERFTRGFFCLARLRKVEFRDLYGVARFAAPSLHALLRVTRCKEASGGSPAWRASISEQIFSSFCS